MMVLHHLRTLHMIEQHFAAREAPGVTIHRVSHKHFQTYMVKIHSTLYFHPGQSSSMPCWRSLSRSDADGLSGHTRGEGTGAAAGGERGRVWSCMVRTTTCVGVKLLVEEVCEGSVVSLLVLLLDSSSIQASQAASVIGRLLASLIISGCVLGEEDSEGPIVSLPVF